MDYAERLAAVKSAADAAEVKAPEGNVWEGVRVESDGMIQFKSPRAGYIQGPTRMTEQQARDMLALLLQLFPRED